MASVCSGADGRVQEFAWGLFLTTKSTKDTKGDYGRVGLGTLHGLHALHGLIILQSLPEIRSLGF